jgi:ribosome-binding factor A
MSRDSRRSRGHRPSGELHVVSPEGGGPEGGGAAHRQVRLERILWLELVSLLRDEIADPSLASVRLISVELSPDGGHARVAYAVEGRLEDESLARERSRQALLKATGFLRAQLASRLDMKRTPKLSFAFVGMVEEPGGAPWPG